MSALVRWLPASGLLAAMALGLTGLFAPPPPVAGAPAGEIAAYYTGHRVGLEFESVADGIGVTFLVIFGATFHARLRTIPSLTAFAAAAIVAACALGQVAAFEALAYRPDPEPARAALLNDLQSFTFEAMTFPTLLLLGAAAAAVFGSPALPPWLGVAAVVAAVLQAVAWISFFAPPGNLAAGAFPNIASFASMLVWLVACSVVMLVRSRDRLDVPTPVPG